MFFIIRSKTVLQEKKQSDSAAESPRTHFLGKGKGLFRKATEIQLLNGGITGVSPLLFTISESAGLRNSNAGTQQSRPQRGLHTVQSTVWTRVESLGSVDFTRKLKSYHTVVKSHAFFLQESLLKNRADQVQLFFHA